jgi:hypothetical protein
VTDQPTLQPVIKPAEHCGDISPGPLGHRSECVLRPGHSGSHADERGGRWWLDPAWTTPDNPATGSDTADSPLRARIRALADEHPVAIPTNLVEEALDQTREQP